MNDENKKLPKKSRNNSNAIELPKKPGPKKQLPNKILDVESDEISLREYRIESLSDFIGVITDLSSQGFTFFRGDKNRDNYSLVPKVYLPLYNNLLKHLDEAIEEFSALNLGRNNLVSNGFLEDMINAQHYELPTRLLDWTESALIALFFAVSSVKDSNSDSIVWALNPIVLNSRTNFLQKFGYVPIFPSKQDKELVAELENYYKAIKDGDAKHPIAIKTRKINPRIDAQRGVFVLFCHNDDRQCLTKYNNSNEFLYKITIPYQSAQVIQKDLKSMGITQYSIFPEVKSISIDLTSKFNKESR